MNESQHHPASADLLASFDGEQREACVLSTGVNGDLPTKRIHFVARRQHRTPTNLGGPRPARFEVPFEAFGLNGDVLCWRAEWNQSACVSLEIRVVGKLCHCVRLTAKRCVSSSGQRGVDSMLGEVSNRVERCQFMIQATTRGANHNH